MISRYEKKLSSIFILLVNSLLRLHFNQADIVFIDLSVTEARCSLIFSYKVPSSYFLDFQCATYCHADN